MNTADVLFSYRPKFVLFSYRPNFEFFDRRAVPSSLLPPMESETVILGLVVPPVRLSPDEEQGWW